MDCPVNEEDKEKLFRQLKHSLGYPLRNIELEDEQLCTLLEMAIEEYAQYIQEWLVTHQWYSVLGHSADNLDMSFALTVRDVDLVTQFTYAYSKQQGLQARGPWELKKDYIEIQPGKQVYEIPAGREVNEVLWITPPDTRMALFANYGGFDYGFGGGFSQMGNSGAGGGAGGAGGNNGYGGGYYIAPAYDVLLTASDLNLKHRIMRSELVYKITAGPNGTKLLHLLSTPGSRFTFGHGMGAPGHGLGGMGGLGLAGCRVWYYYYDTYGGDPEECRKENDDVIRTPNDVPLSKLDYDDFNEPTKILVRKLFIARAKVTLGRTRGKFGGVVGPPEAERTMDWETLLSEGNEEWNSVLERLDERLDNLSTTSQLERAAKEAEDLNTHLRYRPLQFWVF